MQFSVTKEQLTYTRKHGIIIKENTAAPRVQERERAVQLLSWQAVALPVFVLGVSGGSGSEMSISDCRKLSSCLEWRRSHLSGRTWWDAEADPC